MYEIIIFNTVRDLILSNILSYLSSWDENTNCLFSLYILIYSSFFILFIWQFFVFVFIDAFKALITMIINQLVFEANF